MTAPVDLARCARECLARAAQVETPKKLEEDARAILQRSDARQLASLADSAGMQTLQRAADAAVDSNQTTIEEVLRVLGGRRKTKE